MKRYLLVLGFFITGLASCKKEATFNAAQQAVTDDANIQAYIKANNISATKDPSGIYYDVLIPGTGAYPNTNSTITVNYSGKLLNGSVFDSESAFTTTFSGVIAGWEAITHINTGGRILLLIPSALGYGNTANQGIPANSVLIFTIDLTGFNN